MAVTKDEAGGFSATLIERDHRTVVKVSGELDAATVETLHTCVEGLGPSVSDGIVVADLSDLTFIDSTGISGMIAAAKGLRERGATFTIVNCQPNVRRTLEITGTLDFLTTGMA
jgi:anti-sigma B factor antagonist